MVRQIDWEERCWQLSHDVAVRLAIEAQESGKDPAVAAREAVMVAATTCEVYRTAVETSLRKAGGQA